MASQMHPAQGAKQDSAKGGRLVLAQPTATPSAVQRLVIGLGKEAAAAAPHERSRRDTVSGRFSATQTHTRLGSAQRNDTQGVRRWSGPWGRESQANGPQRASRVESETLKGKKWWLSRRSPHRQKQRGGDGSKMGQGPWWEKGKDSVGNRGQAMENVGDQLVLTGSSRRPRRCDTLGVPSIQLRPLLIVNIPTSRGHLAFSSCQTSSLSFSDFRGRCGFFPYRPAQYAVNL